MENIIHETRVEDLLSYKGIRKIVVMFKDDPSEEYLLQFKQNFCIEKYVSGAIALNWFLFTFSHAIDNDLIERIRSCPEVEYAGEYVFDSEFK